MMNWPNEASRERPESRASQSQHNRLMNTLIAPLAFTMGDACGIGPEIIAMLHRDHAALGCVVVGDVAVMRRAAQLVGGFVAVALIEHPSEAAQVPPHCMAVLQAENLPANLMGEPWGRVSASAGEAAARCIGQAVEWAMQGVLRGIVTAPIHKQSFAAAGCEYPGHTELLQALASAGGPLLPVRMMLANEALRTVLVTAHLSLRQAIDAITLEGVLQTVNMAHESLVRYGVPQPRIAVAGLNPHAGEGGLLGDEELKVIGPAVAAANAQGLNVSGPLAPDTVFMRARHAPDHVGEFDVVVAMTHDHALIPVKYLGLAQGVNVTLGLPFVRTSPDHGTAFELAGSGQADASSLLAALRVAEKLSLLPSAESRGQGNL
jgi:4-hydroxythreonine-4-phosphate dehydrogenase